MYQKLKYLIENELFFTSVLIILVASASFFLGRESVTMLTEGSSVNQVGLVKNVVNTATSSGRGPSLTTEKVNRDDYSKTGQYVASKTGTKYHLDTCPGAKQIKETNKIYFATPEEAEAAGYSKAANCPGL